MNANAAAMYEQTTVHVLHFMTQQVDENPEDAEMMPAMRIMIAWHPPAQYQKENKKPTRPAMAPMILRARSREEGAARARARVRQASPNRNARVRAPGQQAHAPADAPGDSPAAEALERSGRVRAAARHGNRYWGSLVLKNWNVTPDVMAPAAAGGIRRRCWKPPASAAL